VDGSAGRQDTQLKKASLGAWSIVFFVVAAAAPLGAITGGGAMTFAMKGATAPAMYIVAGVILMFFAVGLATMSRYVTSAGGLAAFASRGLGLRAGHIMGGLAPIAYAGCLISIYGQFGAFAADLFQNFFDINLPWQIPTACAIVLVAVLGYLEIDLSAKVLGVLLVCEVLILLVFDFVVIAKGGGDSGLSLEAFRPSSVFGVDMAVPLLMAFGCFVGFEATTLYGEEAKDPKKTVPRATYLAISIIGVFFALSTWAIGVAYGTANVQQAAIDDPVGFVFAMNTEFVGQWSTDIMQVLVLTSLFAVVLSVHNTIGRYLFSLGRAQFFPVALARTHPKHKSPYVASLTVSVATVVILGVFMIAKADPMMVVFLWAISIGQLGVLVLQAVGSISVIAFFRRHPNKEGLWRTLIAPLIGALGLVGAVVLAVVYFDQLVGTDATVARVLPWFVPAGMVGGLILGIVRGRKRIKVDLGRDPSEYEQLEPETSQAN